MSEQEAGKTAAPTAPYEFAHAGVGGRMKNWLQDEGPWWLCSFVFHLVLVCSLALISGRVVEKVVDEAPSFEEASIDKQADVPQEIERFEVGETPEDPTELNADTLSLEKPAQIAQEEKRADAAVFSEKSAVVTGQSNVGGVAGFDVKALGAIGSGKGKVGEFKGTGITARGGSEGGWGFGGRTSGTKKAMLGSSGGTRQSERSVAAALNWIARHQMPDGSWSLKAYKARCKDPSCGAPSTLGDRPGGATALGLLPFLAAGQTHESKGRYRQNIYAGISYLVKNQKKDGDLRMTGGQMYDHGLATIALCECYGMTGDKIVGRAAQAGLNFIAAAQDPNTGGWWYNPRQPGGDMSVVGWQFMAMKSGLMGYLSVNPIVFERAKVFLRAMSVGTKGCLGAGSGFGYTTPSASPSLSPVGLLCCQYLGAPRTDPAIMEGTAALMRAQPDANAKCIYRWYYATQVMHNQPGPDWDVWNRKMRRVLIETQCKEANCAAGSWDPKGDGIAVMGGRLFMTSLSTLTLEVYYRYLPLYKLDKDDTGGMNAEKPAKKGAGLESPQPAKKAAK
jgi:hypothetical protein